MGWMTQGPCVYLPAPHRSGQWALGERGAMMGLPARAGSCSELEDLWMFVVFASLRFTLHMGCVVVDLRVALIADFVYNSFLS